MSSTMQPTIGERPEIRWVTCSQLLVDHAYQRMAEEPASKRLIRQIATDWDWRLCGTLTVSDRSGAERGLYVIDGQHRLAAARLRGDISETHQLHQGEPRCRSRLIASWRT